MASITIPKDLDKNISEEKLDHLENEKAVLYERRSFIYMKTLFYLSFFALLFTNCTHHIVRENYQYDQSNSDTCDIIIKKDFVVADNIFRN